MVKKWLKIVKNCQKLSKIKNKMVKNGQNGVEDLYEWSESSPFCQKVVNYWQKLSKSS